MKFRDLIKVSILFVASAYFMGCDDDVDQFQDKCANVTCTDGQVCKDGACVASAECKENSDCTDGKVCEEGKCQEPKVEIECNAFKPCVDNKKCVDNKCVTPEVTWKCSSNTDCDKGRICDNGSCITNPDNECMGSGDCPEGMRCDADENNKKICVDACTNKVCGEFEFCDKGKCVENCTLCTETQRCENKQCVDICQGVVCNEGLSCVMGACVDLCKDVKCPEGQGCINGECKVVYVDKCVGVDCVDGQTCVDGVCVGAVDRCKGKVCVSGYVCIDGECVVSKDSMTNDSDNDGISNFFEGIEENIDTDGDGIPDYRDDDSDGDGVPDKIEGGKNNLEEAPLDSDGDTIPDFRDVDSDNNGIVDRDEAYIEELIPGSYEIKQTLKDSDNDTIPDYADLDNDGDGVVDVNEITGLPLSGTPDLDEAGNPIRGADCNGDGKADPIGSAENSWDCDGDTIPDYMDSDSDGDTIPDVIEGGSLDPDGDNYYNRYDQDSDGDSLPDNVEAGELIDGLPANNDGDAYFDFLDEDSDNDGLLDKYEPECDGSLSRLIRDFDGDGYSDSSEYAVAISVGEDPAVLVCDGEVGVRDYIEFYFELPYGGKELSEPLLFKTGVAKLDLFFNVDTTGSMSGTISGLKSSITNIISKVRSSVSNTAFGLGVFDDFPVNSYGSGPDLPWRLIGTPSTVEATVSKYMSNPLFTIRNGDDGEESGYESIWQIVKGDVEEKQACWKYSSGDAGFAGCIDFYTKNDADHWGGVGFRKDTLPVVVHATDYSSHDYNNAPYDPGYISNPHYSPEVIAALKEKGVRVIPVTAAEWSSEIRRTQMLQLAEESGAKVSVCAFRTSETDWMCGENQCCTGLNNSAEAPVDGMCALNFTVSGSGAGIGDALVAGVQSMVKYATFDVSTRVRGDSIPNTKNTTACFIKKVEAFEFTPPTTEPERTCTPQAQKARFGEEDPGYDNGFKNFATGTSKNDVEGSSLTFVVYAQNDNCVEPQEVTQVFTAYIDVIDPASGVAFDTRTVSIIVPGEFEFTIN